MWSKVKEFFGNVASAIISILLVIALIAAGIIIANKNKNTQENTSNKNPEVSQVFEPSIGTPLPADVTTEEETTQTPAQDSGTVAGENTTEPSQPAATSSSTTSYVAPTSGIDPTSPIPYYNETYGIRITLPAHTKISERPAFISFGKLFTINIVSNAESLDTIASELSHSPEVSNVRPTILSGTQALTFTTKETTGYVVVKNNKAYYLIGQDRYITQIKI